MGSQIGDPDELTVLVTGFGVRLSPSLPRIRITTSLSPSREIHEVV